MTGDILWTGWKRKKDDTKSMDKIKEKIHFPNSSETTRLFRQKEEGKSWEQFLGKLEHM